MSTAAETHDDHHDGHQDPYHLAHHFDTPQQQFDAGKLGIWLFLTTEILLFSGLFCAYAVYRANHPEVFEFAHLYLNKPLGAINTVVLLFSSLTMAWGVRAAQLGQKNLLVGLLALTILCGFGFLGIKFVEYRVKFQNGELWGPHYNPKEMPGAAKDEDDRAKEDRQREAERKKHEEAITVAALTNTVATAPAGYHYDQSKYAPASSDNVDFASISPEWVRQQGSDTKPPGSIAETWHGDPPVNAQLFFSIYFVMTGLHGLHVIAGMICIAWILIRATKGEFGPHYFNPVDFVGLYWHIVDLIWIFLFPLLYLIT